MWLVLLLLALLFVAPGLFAAGLKWMLLLAVILVIASAVSYPRRPL